MPQETASRILDACLEYIRGQIRTDPRTRGALIQIFDALDSSSGGALHNATDQLLAGFAEQQISAIVRPLPKHNQWSDLALPPDGQAFAIIVDRAFICFVENVDDHFMDSAAAAAANTAAARARLRLVAHTLLMVEMWRQVALCWGIWATSTIPPTDILQIFEGAVLGGVILLRYGAGGDPDLSDGPFIRCRNHLGSSEPIVHKLDVNHMKIITAPLNATAGGPVSINDADTTSAHAGTYYFEPGAIDPMPSGVIGPIFAELPGIPLSDVVDYPD
ncbi:hypothetical protein BOTBODRAFT_168787 [Botryobasidium botryosum FD-172 SS1]|uniref:Uncharacterized protein n=1 Tax=Botryobasidium botryosum (strain FD-172 SS1) TaxID=930990 RepID=A0A067N0K1_BOTB1|nr:hypothetical protein BOTBODRAFT_168787 [Botryobasidium botryosum FD-172 SS1]